MQSRKQVQTSKLIHQQFTDLLLKYGQEWFANTLISVTEVEMTPDLMEAKVYFSCLPDEKANEVQEVLEGMNYDIRGAIGKMLRNKLRRIPHFSFEYDSGMADGDKMDRLLKDLKENEDWSDEEQE